MRCPSAFSLPPEEPIYCYTPHNFTRDQALYARGYCWTELRDALPGVDASLWPSLFEHKLLPYSLLAFAAIMYVPALGWEFLASTRLTSELNFLLQEIDNCSRTIMQLKKELGLTPAAIKRINEAALGKKQLAEDDPLALALGELKLLKNVGS